MKLIKKALILSVIGFNSMTMYAQDTLIMVDHTQRLGRVFEINPTNVKYNILDSEMNIAVLKSDIKCIKYKNGMIDSITFFNPDIHKIIKFHKKYDIANSHFITPTYLNSLIANHPNENLKLGMFTEYKNYRTNSKISRNILIASASIMAAGLISSAIIENQPNRQNSGGLVSPTSEVILTSSMQLSTTGCIISGSFKIRSNNNKKKIINMYNSDVPVNINTKDEDFYTLTYNNGSGDSSVKINRVAIFRGNYLYNNKLMTPKTFHSILTTYPDLATRARLNVLLKEEKKYHKKRIVCGLAIPGAFLTCIAASTIIDGFTNTNISNRND